MPLSAEILLFFMIQFDTIFHVAVLQPPSHAFSRRCLAGFHFRSHAVRASFDFRPLSARRSVFHAFDLRAARFMTVAAMIRRQPPMAAILHNAIRRA